MAYIIKRNPVKYMDGKSAPDTYYKGNLLGLIELTTQAENATRYARKADAVKALKTLPCCKFHIIREEEGVKA